MLSGRFFFIVYTDRRNDFSNTFWSVSEKSFLPSALPALYPDENDTDNLFQI